MFDWVCNMMIVDEEIEIGLNSQTIAYYRSIGYDIPKGESRLNINSREIMRTSHQKIRAICDYCGEQFEIEVRRYYSMIESKWCHKACCKKCAPLKRKEANVNHYGVELPMLLPENREKVRNTLVAKYGVDHISKIPGVKEKTKETVRAKYGCDYYLSSADAKQKRKLTNIQKYGVEYISQSDDIKKQMRSSNLQKYGVEFVSQLESVKNKVRQTSMERYGATSYFASDKGRKEQLERWMLNGVVPSSKMQRHICGIVNGELNYPWHSFFFDALYGDWLDIEYNGGGHDLLVKLGKMTSEEFAKKERSRTAAIINSGYKQLVLSNQFDAKIDDDVLCAAIFEGIFFLENFDDKYLMIDFNTREISTTFM